MRYTIGNNSMQTSICLPDKEGNLMPLLNITSSPKPAKGDTIVDDVTENIIAILNGFEPYRTIQGALLLTQTTLMPSYLVEIGRGPGVADKTQLVLVPHVTAPNGALQDLYARIKANGGIESMANRFKFMKFPGAKPESPKPPSP